MKIKMATTTKIALRRLTFEPTFDNEWSKTRLCTNTFRYFLLLASLILHSMRIRRWRLTSYSNSVNLLKPRVRQLLIRWMLVLLLASRILGKGRQHRVPNKPIFENADIQSMFGLPIHGFLADSGILVNGRWLYSHGLSVQVRYDGLATGSWPTGRLNLRVKDVYVQMSSENTQHELHKLEVRCRRLPWWETYHQERCSEMWA